jgi:hypothetical protein
LFETIGKWHQDRGEHRRDGERNPDRSEQPKDGQDDGDNADDAEYKPRADPNGPQPRRGLKRDEFALGGCCHALRAALNLGTCTIIAASALS